MSCLDSCPENFDDLQDDCKCGIKVYKQGRAISEDEFEFGDCSFPALKPLAELTALVRFQPPCYYMQHVD